MPKRVSQEEFIKRCQSKHNNYYLYNNTIYTKMQDKVCITCPIHGDFWMAAKHHINGSGCPKCNPGTRKSLLGKPAAFIIIIIPIIEPNILGLIRRQNVQFMEPSISALMII